MQDPDAIRHFRLALMALVALVGLGTLGYRTLLGWNLLDSLYMTVITLGSVGFKEVQPLDGPGKVFTIVLIVFGVTIVFWAGTSLVEAAVGEELRHVLRRKRMDKKISRMRDHYIICGYGRMGQQIAKDLGNEGVPYVVIEQNPEQLPKLIAGNIPFVEGDASEDKTLKAAGIEQAKGLIAVLPSDEDNVFIVLSARALNPKLFIIARSILVENENKLRMAGADRVMSPYVMGGHRIAAAVLRPNVFDFLELAMRTDDPRVTIEEIAVGAGSSLVGSTVENCRLRNKIGASIIAIKKNAGDILPNPQDDEVINQGDVLIVLGTPQQLRRVENEIHPEPRVE